MTIVTIRHCREHGYSPAGVRKFLEEHGFDWRDFLANGIDAEKLRATGAGPAIALADKVERSEGSRP